MKSDRTGRVQYGCLPWRSRDGRVEILLITSRGTGRWVLAKGWPMIGIEPAAAAAQEALEEAGVEGNLAPSVGRYPYGKVLKTGEIRPVEVEVFPLEIHTEHDSWREQHERVRQWFTRDEAAAAVAEPELAEIIRAFGQTKSLSPWERWRGANTRRDGEG